MNITSLILTWFKSLHIADKFGIAELAVAQNFWKAGTSAVNNSYKHLIKLCDLGELEKCDGFFRLPGCKSDFKEHSRLLTSQLIQLLIAYPECLINREHYIDLVRLRPDALCLITKNNYGFAFVLEVMNNETREEVNRKQKVWQEWDDAENYLSQLFGCRIPWFEFIVLEPEQSIITFIPKGVV